jgi:hypothetical protein
VHCGKPGHEPDECPSLDVATPEEWLRTSDIGISAVSIYCVLAGTGWAPLHRLDRYGVPDPQPPSDYNDFGRCYRLLKRFPEWRARIGEMRDVPGWAPLVDAWDELEKLYEEDRARGKGPSTLYARLCELRGGP